MEIYIVNPEFKKLAILEEFESFVWTERYSGFGDLQIDLPPGSKWGWISPGTYIMHSESSRVMLVERREEVTDQHGSQKTVVKGRSIEIYLDNRAVFPNKGSYTVWSSSGPLGRIVQGLVDEICVQGIGYTPLDIIPGMYTADTSTSTEWVIASIKRKSLYDAVKELCDSGKLGFGILLRDVEPRLRFFVYEGVKRPGVVFSSALENLTEERLLISWAGHKNTAYVWAKDGKRREIVVPPNGSVNREGLDRRVLHVDASDIDPDEMTEATLVGSLQQRGKEELAARARVRAFDGLIIPGSGFNYNVHYSLGDIVTLEDRFNTKFEVRVTEYIWASDSSGERSYPTFVSIQEEV